MCLSTKVMAQLKWEAYLSVFKKELNLSGEVTER